MVGRRNCTNVCDVRIMTGVATETDLFFVRFKIRLNFRGGEKTKKSEIKKWDTGEVNKKAVKEEVGLMKNVK